MGNYLNNNYTSNKNTPKKISKSKNIIKHDNEINNLMNKINYLKNELSKAKQIIEIQKSTINNLQNKINNYDDAINHYKFLLYRKDKELYDIKSQLNNNNNNINFYNNNVYFHDRLRVHFISTDKIINFPIICDKSNLFAEIEEKLYQKFPGYREMNNIFSFNGREILRFKTIADNKIKSGLPIILHVPD